MIPYILKRLLLIFPTLLGVLFINFLLVQMTPGGPIEQMIARTRGMADENFTSDHPQESTPQADADLYKKYAVGKGLPPEFIRDLEKQYGFDQPFLSRFWKMMKDYMTFNLGKSYFREVPVSDLIFSKLPTSLTLGFWSIFLIYALSIPLGIRKALKDGDLFDVASSTILIILYAIPSFLVGIMFIVFFAGGNYFDWFPLRGLVSEDWESFSLFHKITDYLWHIVLPISAIVLTGLASITLLTKNSFLDEISKQYVVTARSKGLTRKQILYRHIFRNASIPLFAKFPHAFMQIILGSNLLIEIMFSLDGLGLLGFDAAYNRDYPVMFGSLYLFTLLSLFLHLVGDILYSVLDPRINFKAQ
ncbi:MAG: microcin C ABC transporter permease YejB [Alphaproteobacteria bacterium]